MKRLNGWTTSGLRRAIQRLEREACEGMDDPMTEHYGAGEFVAQAYGSRIKRLGRELERRGAAL